MVKTLLISKIFFSSDLSKRNMSHFDFNDDYILVELTPADLTEESGMNKNVILFYAINIDGLTLTLL